LSFDLAAQAKDITLTQDDFDSVLEGFKPLAIRNVSLHTAGDLGWSDVGGLEDVKKALVETLQWPSKVKIKKTEKSVTTLETRIGWFHSFIPE